MNLIKCSTAMPKIVLSFIVLVTVIVCQASAFNLSPKPNLVYAEPKLPAYMPKSRSSYFGFTVNLRKNSIMIGAPRAQSSLGSQRSINETGAIYKCLLSSGKCEPFIFDNLGNTNDESNEYTYNSEKKDYQWLGAASDGNGLETDSFVVCAPRIVGDTGSQYLMNGVCYWTSNTIDSKPGDTKKFAPLRLKSKQYIQDTLTNENTYYHMLGEQGLSVHITENNDEILIGAPGIYSWKGSVVRYQAVSQDPGNQLSKRDVTDGKHSIQKRNVEFRSDIPNPSIWMQDSSSYFGYAVSSGIFGGTHSSKLLYVASAPQANNQQGEVYIFDIVADGYSSDKTIKIYHTFGSQQMGEYFGYALVSEDFDNDGFTDLAIAAPFHSRGGASYDNGAVHVYQNIDGHSFELHSTLRSDYELNGRFGTAISKIGDINNDGYNDLAVGAPYEGQGAVYIFLGSTNGLLAKASQRIEAPLSSSLTAPAATKTDMFGYGVSKGVDIDGNNYLDLAIGAPEAEAVYVYKAYPVVKFDAKIVPGNREIKTTDNSMRLKACWALISKYTVRPDIRFKIEIKLDPQHGRVKFSDDPTSNTKDLNVTANAKEECRTFDALVTFSIADIFKPIDLDMNYEVLDGIPNSDEFCATCVAINPNDPKVIKNKVVFNTGCASDRCVANLKLTSTISNPVPYILGSSKSMIVDYRVENLAETAYLTQLNISIPDSVTFLKIPSVCRQHADSLNDLLCDINSGSPLFNNSVAYFKLTLDTTKLHRGQLQIKAHVFSTGDELHDLDNIVNDKIAVGESSDIEISGKSTKPLLSLEDGLLIENISHTFEIRNIGPSTAKNVDVLLSIPVLYLNPWNMQRVKIIDFDNVTVDCTYENQFYDVEWSQNNTVLIKGAFESSSLPVIIADSNMNGMSFDTARIGLEYDLNAGSIHDLSNPENEISRRKRRDMLESSVTQNSINYRNYNLYSHNVQEYQAMSRHRIDIIQSDSVLSNLPVNRTILFDCYDAEAGLCIQARFSVNNFRKGDNPIYIRLNFTVDLSRVDKIVTEKQDIFVLISSAQILKSDDDNGVTINVVQKHPYSIISKYHVQGTPIWVYVVAVIGGLLTLILITYGLYKAGFFKREKKEELEQFKRQSQALALHQGTDNLDS